MRKIVAVRITDLEGKKNLIAYSARHKNRKREFDIDITGMTKAAIHEAFFEREASRRDPNRE